MDKEYQKLIKNGFVIIKDFYDKAKISEIKELLEESYDINLKHNGLPERDSKDKRVFNLPQIDYKFIEFITDNKLINLLKLGLQDEHYRWIDQEYCNFIIKGSSGRSSGSKLDLHIDSGIPFAGEYPLGFVVITALETSDVNNGCTFVVPRSHCFGKYTDRNDKTLDLIQVELKAGDIAIIDSRIWHGAGENLIHKSRWTINTHYVRWFIKQDFDIPKMLSQDIYDKCSIQQKILLGFCSIPSTNKNKRINIKTGVEDLAAKVSEYN